ncbi:MAG TPA: hydroxysqualene dehydroxylase HpnE [Bryobacteraceae bacterium]|nr:hydroxysqualene dehydroxylase HpnE [Bryobacteraceae bacterium]
MEEVIVVGGGLAGMAATAALAGAGFPVTLLEARPYLGGRASSFPIPGRGDTAEVIDNCQHVLLGCFHNLLDLYERLGVRERIRFFEEYYFLEPGGRMSVLRAGRLPPPLHLAGSFLRLRFLDLRSKLAVLRALAALNKDCLREDLDQITMQDWLAEKRQPPAAVEGFWRPVLVSAINEELDRMAARHGFQVFLLAFLGSREAARMGLPAVPLGELYASGAWAGLRNVRIRCRAAVDRIVVHAGRACGVLVNGERLEAAYVVAALPFDRLPTVVPEAGVDTTRFEYSPITGIHLWFDRPVTDLPYAALLGRTIQWFFNKSGGSYLQVVVSASRQLIRKSRGEVVELAVRELGEFLPAVRHARLEASHVIKELRATFSARPGLEEVRPGPETRIANLFLAGDWTRSGWPATMEGAVRSGYLAAEAVTRAAGRPRRFLISGPPDGLR